MEIKYGFHVTTTVNRAMYEAVMWAQTNAIIVLAWLAFVGSQYEIL